MTKTKSINIVCGVIFCLFGAFYGGNQLLVNNIVAFFNGGEAQLATLSTCIYLGTLIMVLLFGEMTQRVGNKNGVCITLGLMGLGYIVTFCAGNLYVAAAGLLLYSMGAGGFESGLYALLTERNGERTAKLLLTIQMLFSLGAFLSPILLEYALPANRFRAAYMIFTALIAVFLVFFLSIKQSPNPSAEPAARHKTPPTIQLLKKPFILWCMVAMILYIGCEGAVTFWAVNLFSYTSQPALGALALSGFWLASIFGRLFCAGARDTAKLAPYAVLGSILGALMVVLFANPYVKFAGILVLGLAMSPLYPIINYITGNAYPKFSAAAFSLVIFAAALGGVISQPVFGAVASSAGVAAVYWVIIGTLVLLLALLLYIIRAEKKLDHSDL